MPTGSWTLHYDWGCDGSYSSTNITFNSGGTFTSGGLTGEWVSVEGKIMLSWDTGPAKYGGDIVGSSMNGMMTTFAGLNGCWYAIKDTSSSLDQAERKPELDAAGQKAEY